MKSGTTPQTNRYTTLPNHPGDIPEGTLRAILKQAHIEPEVFLQKK
jgi:predicted RNA binding protein YcfA (HicA-like mRNA interferase family)